MARFDTLMDRFAFGRAIEILTALGGLKRVREIYTLGYIATGCDRFLQSESTLDMPRAREDHLLKSQFSLGLACQRRQLCASSPCKPILWHT